MSLYDLKREETVNLAMMMGKVLLKSGAETSRVEDTITRFCSANGCSDINVFVTPTVIIMGDEKPGGLHAVCRIRYRSTNLSAISEINDLSYNVRTWPLNYVETMHYLEGKLQENPPYGKWLVCLAAGIGSACFSFMLGGNSHDFIAAFITGLLSMAVLKMLGELRPSVFWENVLAGAAIGVIAIICCKVSSECAMEKVIVGGLMPFLPGLYFTNSLRDYMAGDLVSGNSRMAEALLFASSLAVGLAFSLHVWYRLGMNL